MIFDRMEENKNVIKYYQSAGEKTSASKEDVSSVD